MKRRSRFLLTLFILSLSSCLYAQPLVLKVVNGKPFLEHTVEAKENYYSIGRIYNISPRIMVPFNGLTLNSGLSIGQVLKVPLDEQNFYRGGDRKSNEVLVPLYHEVSDREGLLRISQIYAVSIDQLKAWNHLSTNNVNIGDRLVIGYLKVDKELSSLAAYAKNVSPVIARQPKENKVVEEKKPEVKTTVPPQQDVVANTTARTQANTVQNPPPKKELIKTTSAYKGEGFFKPEFELQSRNGQVRNLGSCGLFKSTSGWNNGKFYALMNNVEKGTIVKVTNRDNGKSIFAKVLAEVESPEAGLLIRISDAAASQLGSAFADKLNVEVSYGR